jgi:hypothetical protein
MRKVANLQTWFEDNFDRKCGHFGSQTLGRNLLIVKKKQYIPKNPNK